MITQLLIADSDTLLLDRCRAHLARRAYQVAVAGNGLECLDSLRRIPPDVLILGYELLWGGGDGVLDCLREDRLRWPTTVILTLGDDVGDGFAVLQPPVKALLDKPFNLSRPTGVIEGTLGRAADGGRVSRSGSTGGRLGTAPAQATWCFR